MGRGAINVVKYGKIELSSTDETASIDDLITHLHDILEKHGYPESEPDLPVDSADLEVKEDMDDEDIEDLKEAGVEDEEDALEEPGSKPAPWEVAKRGRTQ